MEEYSLRSQVFQTIRDDILKGKYEENDELREATLGKELGVSRTPVREALRQLELEGLVNIIPNKGAYVTGISDKDVHDIYMIRFHAGRIMRPLGNRTYYTGAAGRTG